MHAKCNRSSEPPFAASELHLPESCLFAKERGVSGIGQLGKEE
ncbi:hypothetical protein [Dyadobacter fermentans]|uniref:Uncharacterized protein n=1 Tax=Dyadobacter fermentans (strain ATCC 700827 / DSM 18053 / CIP 107007 / KCTC 52180 / NS114) TaxID=471854 RepID=C6VVK4_DYAFD|nr:hypothetical protein [Dyadobacter fermentans]ACT96734.1 hypothetical protein Dfer_5544 [Dyadobacter fermentans DSM 18053]